MKTFFRILLTLLVSFSLKAQYSFDTPIVPTDTTISIGATLLRWDTLYIKYIPALHGTSKQAIVTQNGSAITISLPQDIDTTARPVFNGLTAHGLIKADSGKFGKTVFLLIDTTGTVKSGVWDAGTITVVDSINNSTFNSSVIIAPKKWIGTSSFASGWTGYGWQIAPDTSYVGGSGAASGYGATFDQLTVRGNMKIYELIIQQLRSNNGSVVISDNGKVDTVASAYAGDSVKVKFDDRVSFVQYDLILAQRFHQDTSGRAYVYQVRATVGACNYADSTAYIHFYASSDSTSFRTYYKGMEFVRIGNTHRTDRQGCIYLSADDDGAPLVDIKDGVSSFALFNDSTTTKARLGQLSGIRDINVGLTGSSQYGLYSDNVYLRGIIVALAGGRLGGTNGWYIRSGKITSVGGNGNYVGMNSDTTQTTKAFFAGATDTLGTSAHFYATPKGYVYSDSALFGTWNLGYNKLYSGSTRLESSTDLKGLAVSKTLSDAASYDVLKAGDYTVSPISSSRLLYNISYSGDKWDTSSVSADYSGYWDGDIAHNLVTLYGGQTSTLGSDKVASVGIKFSTNISNKYVRAKVIIHCARAITGTSNNLGYTITYFDSTISNLNIFHVYGITDTIDTGWYLVTGNDSIYVSFYTDDDVGGIFDYGDATVSVLSFQYYDPQPFVDISPTGLRIWDSGGNRELSYDSSGLNIWGTANFWGNVNITGTAAINPMGYNPTNWNTAYSERLEWDGGSTNLNAATGRSSLGLGSMALADSTKYHGSPSINTVGSSSNPFTIGGRTIFGASSYGGTTGAAYTTASGGLNFEGKTGSSYDFVFINGSGGTVIANPTGTTGIILGTALDTAYTDAVSNVTASAPINVTTLGKTKKLSVDTSTATTGLTTLYENGLKADKSTTMTIAGNTPLSSSASAQDLSANRTWTLSLDTTNATTGTTTLYQNGLKANKAITFSAGTAISSTGLGDLSSNRTINADTTFYSTTSKSGFLKYTDWNTFNNKIGSLNGLMPVTQTFAIDSTYNTWGINSATSTHTWRFPGTRLGFLDKANTWGAGQTFNDFIAANSSSGITTNQTTFPLINTTATTVNAFGAATSLTLGATTGTATFRNATNNFANSTAFKIRGTTIIDSSRNLSNIGTISSGAITSTGIFGLTGNIYLFQGNSNITQQVSSTQLDINPYANLRLFRISGSGAGSLQILQPNTSSVSTSIDASTGNIFTIGNMGIGHSGSSAKTEILATTEQLRLSYDTTHYTSFTTASSGDLTIGGTTGNAFLTGKTGSSTYASRTTGWQTSNSGYGDFRYLYADELHAKSFIADLEQTKVGSEIIVNSAAKVDSVDFTVPTAGNSATLIVEEYAGFTGQTFANNDTVQLRSFTRTSGNGLTIASAWGTVTYKYRNASNNPPTQAYTFLRLSGADSGSFTQAANPIKKGTLALDYGQNAGSYVETNNNDGTNSPYVQTVQFDSVAQVIRGLQKVQTRVGKLTGITSTDFGVLAGSGFYGQNVYAEGNVNVAGNIWALTGGIGGSYSSPAIDLQSYGMAIHPNGGTSSALSNNAIMIGNIIGQANSAIKLTNTGTNSTSGLFGYNASGKTAFRLGLDGVDTLAGTVFNDTSIYSGTGTFANTNTPYFLSKTGRFSLADKLQWNGSTLTINGGGTFSGALSAATGTFAGSLSAATGSFTGAVTANSGTIGGFTATTQSLTAKTTGNTYAGIRSSGQYRFFSGASDTIGTGANFKVDTAGTMTATNGTFSGSVTASSGTIGGFTATTQSLTAKTTGNKYVGMRSSGQYRFFSGASDTNGTGANFKVDTSGTMTASNGTFSGTITSTSGTIGGSTLSSGKITGGEFRTSPYTTTLSAMDGDSIKVGYGVAKFYVASNSEFTAAVEAYIQTTAGVLHVDLDPTGIGTDGTGDYININGYISGNSGVVHTGYIIAQDSTLTAIKPASTRLMNVTSIGGNYNNIKISGDSLVISSPVYSQAYLFSIGKVGLGLDGTLQLINSGGKAATLYYSGITNNAGFSFPDNSTGITHQIAVSNISQIVSFGSATLTDSASSPTISRNIYTSFAEQTGNGSATDKVFTEATHNSTFNDKIITYFVRRAGDKRVKVYWNSTQSISDLNGTACQLYVNGSTTNVSTDGDSNTKRNLSIDVSGLTAGTVYQIKFQMKTITASSDELKANQLVIAVESY